MSVELPVTLIMRANMLPKRWLVYQANGDGKLVYAQTFVLRSNAEKAEKAADERTKFWSPRLPSHLVRLPFDRR